MPSPQLLASAGICQYPPHGYGLAWHNAAAPDQSPTPPGNGDGVQFVLHHISIGGITPLSAGSDAHHEFYDWEYSSPYFLVTPGADASHAGCRSYYTNVRLPDGLYVNNAGLVGELFLSAFTEFLR